MKKKKGLIVLLALLLLLTACNKDQPEVTEEVVETENISESIADEGKVVATKELPQTVMAYTDYEADHPEIVKLFEANSEMSSTTYGGSENYSYLEKYPYLLTFYKGYVFEKEYNRARGHVYALEDVEEIARPKAGASCLACKVSDYNELLKGDSTISSDNFEEFVENHVTTGFSCFDCHGDTPGEIYINREHLLVALDEHNNRDELSTEQLSCAQCHVEYYLRDDDKGVVLPWAYGLGCDEAYQYYQEKGFYDWEHPETGAKLLKAQHPETETFNGSVHDKVGADCIDCHMPEVEVEGKMIASHHWTSPLKTPEASCLKCHSDMDEEGIIKLAEGVQKPIVEKTNTIGLELEKYINLLAEKKDALDETTLSELQDIHREAQFYWDYVFVENGEGFHNWTKQDKYLEHSKELIDKGLELIENV